MAELISSCAKAHKSLDRITLRRIHNILKPTVEICEICGRDIFTYFFNRKGYNKQYVILLTIMTVLFFTKVNSEIVSGWLILPSPSVLFSAVVAFDRILVFK